MKPLLYLDVDGVLNTVVPNEETGQEFEAEGFRICVPRGTDSRLRRLSEAFEIVWATTWRSGANEHIGPMVGLPPLEVLAWGRMSGGYGPSSMKLPAVVEHAEGRDWAFVDDNVYWEVVELLKMGWKGWTVGAETTQRTKIVQPETRVGLEDKHVDKLLDWATLA